MERARFLRIILFAAAVAVFVIGGLFVGDSQARPLLDRYIHLSLSAFPTQYTHAGEVITYTYEVRNTSNYLLYNVTIADTGVDVTCPGSEIAIDGQMTCSGAYTVTQGDVERGSLTNIARVEGTFKIESDRSGGCCAGTTYDYYDAAAEDSFTLSGPAYSLSLTIAGQPGAYRWAGEEIQYTYFVTNTGTGRLEGPITIEDDTLQVDCPGGGLESNETMECTGSYITTDGDVAAMVIHNAAVASADYDASATAECEVALQQLPSLLLASEASSPTYSLHWQLIIWRLTVTNNGNIPVEGPFQVQNPMLDEWTCPATEVLGLGESLTCLGYYRTRHPLGRTITSCDIVSGSIQGGTIYSNESCTQIAYIPAQGPPPGPPTPTPTEEDPF